MEYYIPKYIKYVFVADLFLENYLGGAELSTETLYEIAPQIQLENGIQKNSVFKLHSNSVTEDLIKQNSDKHWIFFNWSQVPIHLLGLFINKIKYSVVEYDYKFCKYRSVHLHEMVEKITCNCNETALGKSVLKFYLLSSNLFFMSEKQREVFIDNFPVLEKLILEKSTILSSLWTNRNLDFLSSLRKENKNKSDSWVVLSGGSWIKNQEATEKYCLDKKIPYVRLGNLPYESFLKEMVRYKGLIFHPKGHDTCPRIVVEAKLLGLELDLNEHVQHKDEKWFNTSNLNDIELYLQERPKLFWQKIEGK